MGVSVKGKRKHSKSHAHKRIVIAATVLLAAVACLLALSEALRLKAPQPEPVAIATVNVESPPFERIQFAFGRGYIGDGWRVYFNEPRSDAESASYADGIDVQLASAIDAARQGLDIAAFELNSDVIFRAILDAHQRGLEVRIVTDDQHGLHDDKNPHLRELAAAGVPVIDDARSGLMHNKFMILDSRVVWTGSWNYTVNGTYRNNNNALVIEDPIVVAGYQAEFDEMFTRGEFGPRSRDDGKVSAGLGGGEIQVIFAPEAEEIPLLQREIARADASIRIMTFVFSLDELAGAILDKMIDNDIVVQGVFEKRNSTASWSQLPTLLCAGADLRQDGNRYILHHKVLLIDDDTVITGSFNFSNAAARNNDENIIIIRNADIAQAYHDEWARIWDSAQAVAPGDVNCV